MSHREDSGRIGWISVFADVPDPLLERAAAYWQTITGDGLGEPQGEHGEFLPLRPADGEAVLWLQAVRRDEPGWHLDLYRDDVASAVENAVEFGARVVHDADWWVSLASPGGLPFCLTRRNGPPPTVPVGVTWPDGHRSAFDQLCLDIPDMIFDAETAFWSALTGWPSRATDLAEFVRLRRPDGVAVHVLLQRLGADDARGMRAHADLAATDRPAETARHVEAGGRVEYEAEQWTTLRDPAGLLYCITDRPPRD